MMKKVVITSTLMLVSAVVTGSAMSYPNGYAQGLSSSDSSSSSLSASPSSSNSIQSEPNLKERLIEGIVQLKSNPQARENFISARNQKLYNREHILKTIQTLLNSLPVAELQQALSKRDIIVDKSIEEVQDLMEKKQLTSKEMIIIGLIRIAQLDKNGLFLNSISEINPKCIEDAEEKDRNRSQQPLPRRKNSVYGTTFLVKG